MSTEQMCPRRSESPLQVTKPPDTWLGDVGARTCSYCGSFHSDDFFAKVEQGFEVTPTDKNYKTYISDGKFYFQHLDGQPQRDRFITLYNSKTMKLAYPGHFYSMPFFCKRGP